MVAGVLGDIINNAVDMAYFIGDAVGYFDQSGVWNFAQSAVIKSEVVTARNAKEV